MAYRQINLNPEQKRVGDCTVRAIAAATHQDWAAVYAALVLAGLVCEDCVTIKHSERIDRGYEEIDKKIHLLGGRIRKEKD